MTNNDEPERNAWHGHREKVLKDAGLWDEYKDKEPTVNDD